MKYTLGLNSELFEPSELEYVKKFEGVGMIRGENLCIEKMQYFTMPDFCNHVTSYLDYIAKIFKNYDVWYRTADLVPHQINALEGCDAVLSEKEFLLGLRGVRRNLKYIDTYKKELEAFLRAYKENKNLGLLIPFVSLSEEMHKVINILRNEYCYDGKIGMMLEIPSSIILLDEFKKMGIHNYVIGVNDLTTMLLGSNRDITNYDINNPSVLKFLEKIRYLFNTDDDVIVAGYLNKEFCNNCEQIGYTKINVHYNDIPIIFDDIENPEIFTSHYDEIKKNYKRVRNKK